MKGENMNFNGFKPLTPRYEDLNYLEPIKENTKRAMNFFNSPSKNFFKLPSKTTLQPIVDNGVSFNVNDGTRIKRICIPKNNIIHIAEKSVYGTDTLKTEVTYMVHDAIQSIIISDDYETAIKKAFSNN